MRIVNALRRAKRRHGMWRGLLDTNGECVGVVAGGPLVVRLGRGAPTVYLRRATPEGMPALGRAASIDREVA